MSGCSIRMVRMYLSGFTSTLAKAETGGCKHIYSPVFTEVSLVNTIVLGCMYSLVHVYTSGFIDIMVHIRWMGFNCIEVRKYTTG